MKLVALFMLEIMRISIFKKILKSKNKNSFMLFLR
jgi:hypothetical protein